MTAPGTPNGGILASKFGKYRAVVALLAAGEVVQNVESVRTWGIGHYTQYQRKRQFFISVMERDSYYDNVHQWLVKMSGDDLPRSLTARWRRPTKGEDNQSHVALSYDAKSKVQFVLNGVRYTAEITDGDKNPEDSDDAPASVTAARSDRMGQRIAFTCPTEKAREALIEKLGEIYRKASFDPPTVYLADRWHDWNSMRGIPSRDLDSVILREGVRERIRADLEEFLDNEERYVSLGIPWHRGYLLHGPPGTGKTSFARALATSFGLNSYIMSLSSVDDDGALFGLLRHIPPRSLVVMEDIDVVHSSRDREDDTGVTLAGLLNALDGLITPHGSILLMTTNHKEVLDEALVRPGRVDVDIEISYVDDYQVAQLASRYIGYEGVLPMLRSDTVVPSQIMEIFKNHLNDPRAALHALEDRLEHDWVDSRVPVLSV